MSAKTFYAYCLAMISCMPFCFVGCGCDGAAPHSKQADTAAPKETAVPDETNTKEGEMKTNQTPDRDNVAAEQQPAATDKTAVELRLKGKIQSLSPAERAALVTAVENLLSSCRDRDKQRVAEPDWQAALENGSSIAVKYTEEKIFDVPARPGLMVTEILVPLGDAPDSQRIFARKQTAIYSPFIGCDRQALEAIDAFR